MQEPEPEPWFAPVTKEWVDIPRRAEQYRHSSPLSLPPPSSAFICITLFHQLSPSTRAEEKTRGRRRREERSLRACVHYSVEWNEQGPLHYSTLSNSNSTPLLHSAVLNPRPFFQPLLCCAALRCAAHSSPLPPFVHLSSPSISSSSTKSPRRTPPPSPLPPKSLSFFSPSPHPATHPTRPLFDRASSSSAPAFSVSSSGGSPPPSYRSRIVAAARNRAPSILSTVPRTTPTDPPTRATVPASTFWFPIEARCRQPSSQDESESRRP
jgi:hypothetical protein